MKYVSWQEWPPLLRPLDKFNKKVVQLRSSLCCVSNKKPVHGDMAGNAFSAMLAWTEALWSAAVHDDMPQNGLEGTLPWTENYLRSLIISYLCVGNKDCGGKI